MGFAFLDKYDVGACASLCNTRGADSMGGACQYFNIWRALVNGEPTTYTCSMVRHSWHFSDSVELIKTLRSTTSLQISLAPLISGKETFKSHIPGAIDAFLYSPTVVLKISIAVISATALRPLIG
jgi:hypothetical protein